MFENTRAAGSTGWAVVAGGTLGALLATLACGGLSFDLFLADRWDTWFPAPDPYADLAFEDASGIDWLVVHRELLPSWVLSAGRAGDSAAERDALLAAVGADPGLVAAIGQLEVALPGVDFAAASAAVEVWNGRLDAAGVPWFVDLASMRNLYVKTYRTLWDGPAAIGERTARVRLLTRVDSLNVVEGYLGQVTDPSDGALVVVDRVAEHAAEDLWPLLDPDSLDPAAGPVTAEVRAALDPAHVAALEATAEARAQLLAGVRAVRERRECSNFVIRSVPALGFSDADLDGMAEAAWQDRGKSCPRLTPGESSSIAESTAVLQGDDALPAALDALLAFALRPTAIHEARHVADAAEFGEVAQVACPGCPEALGGETARGELSAYLSSFADVGVAGCAWVQACSATSGTWGPHAQAFTALAEQLTDDPCDAGVPADLAHRARELEIDWLMREAPVVLPPEFPRTVRWPE